MTEFSGLDSESFVRDYWQRRPLLIPNAVPDFENPLSPEELAGLALEEGSEARLISGQEGDWQLDGSPLDEASFDRDGPWTLLVQSVDQVVPDVAALRQQVKFLPGWRLDDVMVSYATDNGGVGPHYDNYDVFLLQGLGQRRWLLGQYCDGSETLLPSSDLRILADFDTSAEFVLNPGDVLYVPPRLAHWGIARGPCMTYSLGFRAPQVNSLLSRWVDTVLENLPQDQLFEDPVPLERGRPGEITPQVITAARRQLLKALDGTQGSPAWLGEAVTETHSELLIPADLDDMVGSLRLHPAARLAWHADCDTIEVYANGETILADGAAQGLLERLADGLEINREQWVECRDLLCSLAGLGCLQDE